MPSHCAHVRRRGRKKGFRAGPKMTRMVAVQAERSVSVALRV